MLLVPSAPLVLQELQAPQVPLVRPVPSDKLGQLGLPAPQVPPEPQAQRAPATWLDPPGPRVQLDLLASLAQQA